MIGPCETPQAFRSALEARLRNLAQERGIDLQRLQRRVAFDRLLARLFVGDNPPWLLKGGYALELRFEEQARSTLDLDVAVPDPHRLQSLAAVGREAVCVELTYECLQQAAARGLGDGFEYLIGRPRVEQTGAPGGGLRCPAEARLAGRALAKFHLDVGLGDTVLGRPEWVERSSLLGFAGIPAARVALYPVEQQFSEKVHAYTFPWQDRDNTRVKDLVDLVLLIHSGLLHANRVRGALEAAFETRGTHPLPVRLPQPPSAWAEPYAALAQELRLPAATLEEAYASLGAYWQEGRLGHAAGSTPTGRES